MPFLKRAREVLTGKTEIERKQEKAALSEIRKKVIATRLRTQREEAIKFATEVEKEKYKRRLQRLKQPMGFSGNSGYGDLLGKGFGGAVTKSKKQGSKKRFNIITGKWE